MRERKSGVIERQNEVEREKDPEGEREGTKSEREGG